MEERKKLYKAGASSRANPTLSERRINFKGRRINARQDKFAAGRQILLEETPGRLKKATDTKNKNDHVQKLKEYRLLKNTQALDKIQKKKSPFVVAVPVGRWVEKKERVAQPRLDVNQTPVRNALMNERVLKKSTVKDLYAKSTAKKENVMVFGKSFDSSRPMKSKKKILGELNAVLQSSNEEPQPIDLNSTFEVLPELDDEQINAPIKRLRRSNSVPEITRKVKFVKTFTPPTKAVAKKELVKKPLSKAVSLKRIVVSNNTVKPNIASTSRAVLNAVKTKTVAKKTAAKIVKPIASGPARVVVKPKAVEEVAKPEDQEENQVKQWRLTSKKIEVKRSPTFTLYKSMLDTQIAYLRIQLNEIETDKEKFIESVDEEKQISIHASIQQGNLMLSEKLRKFSELLDKYETDLSNPENPKGLSSDDIENYWSLLYDEIDETKKSLDEIREMKKKGSEIKKRRSRRNYNPEEGTPKRSKRIAENVDTPKHHDSCFGCVAVSASRVNTPRSNKRRTTMKKSVLFVQDTPKGITGRRSSKRYKATPKRSLIRMDAMDDDEAVELDEHLM